MTAFSEVFAPRRQSSSWRPALADRSAQQKPRPAPRRAPPAPPPPTLRVDANELAPGFDGSVLEKHPPAVGRVLKLDPSLMRSESYLAGVSRASRFLRAAPGHPAECACTISRRPRESTTTTGRATTAAAGCAGHPCGPGRFHRRSAIVLSTLVWLIRTVARTAALESALEDPGGSPLEADGPLLVERRAAHLRADAVGPAVPRIGPEPAPGDPTPAMGAPLSRILWSLQLGAVLLVGGLGHAVPERPQHDVRRRRSSSTSPAASRRRSAPASSSRPSPPTFSRAGSGSWSGRVTPHKTMRDLTITEIERLRTEES